MNHIPRIDLTNQRIDEYLFQRRLGEGEFGDVWLALEIGIDMSSRQVAIKILAWDAENHDLYEDITIDFLKNIDMIRTLSSHLAIVFYFEARTSSLLINQKGIPITSPDSDEKGGIPLTLFLIVMEYAEGGFLEEDYIRSVIYATGETSHLNHFIDVCYTLEKMHQLGYVHRDLKPQNLLWFKSSSKVKIADFGMVGENRAETYSFDRISGGFPYRAPEVFGELLTKESDIYALGCVLYELFSGSPAFDVEIHRGSSAAQIENLWKSAHISVGRPDVIITAGTIVSFELNEIIKKMMAINPKDRPTLVEVIAALEEEKSSDHVKPSEPTITSRFGAVSGLRHSYRHRHLYASYIPDTVGYGSFREVPVYDSLGVGVYAAHLGQLIAAKDTAMPLSLGLFGSWGSGKSHFMNLLCEYIAALSEDGSESFHRQVVQIRFNAWHYLDTSLWANLACEIFDQLFTRLVENSHTTDEQIKNLKARLAREGALAAEARAALRAAGELREQAEEDLAKATEARITQEKSVEILLGNLETLVMHDPRVKKLLKKAADGLGMPQLTTSLSDLESTVREASSVSGRAKAFALAVFTGPGVGHRAFLLVAALVLPLFISILAAQGGGYVRNLFDGAGRIIAQTVAGIGALTAWIAANLNAGKSVLTSLEEAYAKVKEAQLYGKADPAAIRAQTSLKVKREAEEKAWRVLREIEARILTIQENLLEFTPRRQLMRFVRDRSSSHDYRQHLGLVSLIRRDFERLSCLLLQASEGKDSHLPQIDRIVLYIDDLDRCRSERVIEVLEAIHLLLAFPLFAVVVAVDPRWLRQSLTEQYTSLLDQGRSREVATPQDYLEKIFQIPFNIQPMEKVGFDSLVSHLFPVAAAATLGTNSLGDLNPSNVDTISVSLDATAGSAHPQTAENEHPAMDVRDIPAASRLSSTTPTPGRLVLSEGEILDIRRFQPLFLTPRSLKRFANTYSLIRVGVGMEEWFSYLGNNSAHGGYRTPMLMLAVTASFPAVARPWLSWHCKQVRSSWIPCADDLHTEEERARSDDWVRLFDIFDEAGLDEWLSPDADAVAKWAPLVSRYSF